MSPPRRDPETTEALRASLVDHARILIAREGASALTMRALAEEAECSVGLPYKVFADRHELVVAVCQAEMAKLVEGYHQLAARAGQGTVGANLLWYAEILLDSPAVALVKEIVADPALDQSVADHVQGGADGPGDLEGTLAHYLEAEQREGRVREDVHVDAFGFAIAGAVHNLVVSGSAWPRPSRRQLGRWLDGIAAALAPVHDT